jgi:signal transduction histidine kinase
VAAIEWQARQLQARTGVVCHFDSQVKDVQLTRAQSTAAFRIFQEALTNVARHAHATRVNLAMKEEAGQFILTISDNGRGITAREQTGSETLGLLGMRERAHLIGGEVSIASAEDRGTLVTVRVPIAAAT